MYVYTENGGPLNVRSDPRTGDNVIGQLEYGTAVYVTVFDGDWCGIKFKQRDRMGAEPLPAVERTRPHARTA